MNCGFDYVDVLDEPLRAEVVDLWNAIISELLMVFRIDR